MNSPIADSNGPTLNELLQVLVQNAGSDLHIQAGAPPMGRIHGQLGKFEMAPLTEDDVLRLAREILEWASH